MGQAITHFDLQVSPIRLIAHLRLGTKAISLLAVAAYCCGCAGVATAPGDANTFVISGAVAPPSAANSTTVSLSGPSSKSTTTNTAGGYSFDGLTNGTYVVAPARSGYTFTPATQTVTVNGANLTNINFSGVAAHSVKLSWHASTSAVAGYNLYRSTSSGGPYIKANTVLITALSFTDETVNGGNTYYYVCTSLDSAGVESVYSNEVSAAIP